MMFRERQYRESSRSIILRFPFILEHGFRKWHESATSSINAKYVLTATEDRFWGFEGCSVGSFPSLRKRRDERDFLINRTRAFSFLRASDSRFSRTENQLVHALSTISKGNRSFTSSLLFPN